MTNNDGVGPRITSRPPPHHPPFHPASDHNLERHPVTANPASHTMDTEDFGGLFESTDEVTAEAEIALRYATYECSSLY